MDKVEKDLIVWDEKFAIGIPLIDAEHKTLVALCNSLYRVVTNGNSLGDEKRKEAMSVALRQCVEYSDFHFKHEEELMALCNFDEKKFKEHKAEHISFGKKIAQELKNFDNENFVTAYEFVKYLYDWILTHIAYSDKLYVNDLMKFLKAHPEVRGVHEQKNA